MTRWPCEKYQGLIFNNVLVLLTKISQIHIYDTCLQFTSYHFSSQAFRNTSLHTNAYSWPISCAGLCIKVSIIHKIIVATLVCQSSLSTHTRGQLYVIKTQMASMHKSLTQQLPRYCTEHHYFNWTSHSFLKVTAVCMFQLCLVSVTNVLTQGWEGM